MSTSTSACQFYFVHLDSKLHPIPSTMYSKANNKIDAGYKCREARLPATQMTHTGQCFPKNGLRYFYRVNSQTGQIVPNSFFAQKGKPVSMCSGVNKILEYVIYS